MGELFANFEAYDVQETRRIAREEARKEAREEGIKKLVQALKAVASPQAVVKQQLMEQYGVNEEIADKKIELYW